MINLNVALKELFEGIVNQHSRYPYAEITRLIKKYRPIIEGRSSPKSSEEITVWELLQKELPLHIVPVYRHKSKRWIMVNSETEDPLTVTEAPTLDECLRIYSEVYNEREEQPH